MSRLRIVLLGVFSAALLVTLLHAAKVPDKPFTEWTQKEAQRLLRGSGWSQTYVDKKLLAQGPSSPRPQASPEGSGGAYGGGPTLPSGSQQQIRATAAYTISFLSAKPIRMALARLAMLQGSLAAPAAELFVNNSFEDEIVISVATPPGQDPGVFERLSKAQLQESTYLLLKKSKEKIYLSDYINPSRSPNGRPLFVFPRHREGSVLVTLEEKEVRFVAILDPDTRVEQKFKLRDMIFDGNLEI